MASDVNVQVIRLGAPQDPEGSATLVQQRVRLAHGTPKAVIAIHAKRVEVGNVIIPVNDGGGFSVGFYDGTSHYCAATHRANGVAQSQCHRVRGTGSMALQMKNSTSYERHLKGLSFDEDELLLEWDFNSGSDDAAYVTTLIVFSGRDVKAKVGTAPLTAGVGNPTVINTVGFASDLLFFASADADSAHSHARMAFGCCTFDGSTITQRCALWSQLDADNLFTSGCQLDNRYAVGSLQPGGSFWKGEVTAIGTDGFSITHRENSAGTQDDVGYLALDLGDTPVSLVTLTSPTSEGVENYTDLGSRPQAVIIAQTLVTTANSEASTSPGADYLGIGAIADRPRHAVCLSSTYKTGGSGNPVASSADSRIDRAAVLARDGGSNVILAAEFDGFTDTGFDLDWTDTDATARLGWALSIGQNSVQEPRIGRVHSFLDVTQPGRGLAPVPIRSDGSAELQAIANSYLTDQPDNSATLYFPNNEYHFGSTVTFPNANGWRIQGGGGMGKSLTDLEAGRGAFSLLRWTGGTTGPMFLIGDSNGLVWEYLTFDGVLGPDTVNAAGNVISGLDHLIIFDALNGGFVHSFRNCAFFRAENLWYCRDAGTPPDEEDHGAPAELTFDKCYWNCGATVSSAWTAVAFLQDERQTVNCLFQNNEFNNCPICVQSRENPTFLDGPAGRVLMRDLTVANVGLLLELNRSTTNVAGYLIDGAHIDMQTGRCNYVRMKSANGVGDIFGNVVIRRMRPGSDHHEYNNIVSITAGPPVTLKLVSGGNNLISGTNDGLYLAVGDRVAFVKKDAPEDLVFETTVTKRLYDSSPPTGEYAVSFELADDPTPELPLQGTETVQSHYVARYGEPLITITDQALVLLEDSYLTAHQTRNGGLASFAHDVAGGFGRTGTLIVNRCMGFSAGGMQTASLLKLMKTGPNSDSGSGSGKQFSGTFEETCYYKFRDCYEVSDTSAPTTYANF